MYFRVDFFDITGEFVKEDWSFSISPLIPGFGIVNRGASYVSRDLLNPVSNSWVFH